MKKILIITISWLFFGQMTLATADLFSNNSTTTNTTTNQSQTNSTIGSGSNSQSGNESVDKFFKDATYENFAPQKEEKLFDESYLESHS